MKPKLLIRQPPCCALRYSPFRRPGRLMRVQRGLTMLELCIAIAILAVLGAIAVPTLAARLDQQRLYTAAEALMADINEARFEAARQGRALHVVMDSGEHWCWAVATRAACPCGQAQACELRSAQPRDHAGVRLLQGQHLHLRATGQAEAPGSATLESRRGSRLRVDVQALGRARVCTLVGSAARYPAC